MKVLISLVVTKLCGVRKGHRRGLRSEVDRIDRRQHKERNEGLDSLQGTSLLVHRDLMAST